MIQIQTTTYEYDELGRVIKEVVKVETMHEED